MTSTRIGAGRAAAAWSRRVLRWFAAVVAFFCRVALIGWAALAIRFSNLPWSSMRLGLAVAFVAFGIWALWFARRPRSFLIFAAAFGVVVVWWQTIEPSHDRHWRPEVAVMPRAIIDGDRVRLTGVRNFEYRSADDFTPHYEEREVSLAHLIGVDFYVSYWMPGPVGHTFVSFVFDDVAPVCISIEARPETGEGYAPVASLFKQFELIYVVGDERDLVRLRTNYRRENVYLYHIATSPKNALRLFNVYLERINQLAEHAEFYHLLSNSCTINIVRYAYALGPKARFDIRHYLNGLIDGYLYDTGRLDTALPFETLRQRSLIDQAAQEAGDAQDFSKRIRVSLPPGPSKARPATPAARPHPG
jgi:hypothetical protein